MNVGFGHTKYIIIDHRGVELAPVSFPSLVARAGANVVGSIVTETKVKHNGATWLVGESALTSDQILTKLDVSRLSDLVLIPVLVTEALRRFRHHASATAGYCVSGLPAAWSNVPEHCTALGARLRDGAGQHYTEIRIISESLAVAYAVLLNNHGEVVGDEAFQRGRIGVVDIGHNTVDFATLHRMAPVATSMTTAQLGTLGPLNAIRTLIAGQLGRSLSLYETDLAVRTGSVRVAGKETPLPKEWEQPLRHTGQQIAAAMAEYWRGGTQLDAILVAGGGAELPMITEAIQDVFPGATILPDPQLAIARGYAKLARRLALTAAARGPR